uniref:hypothetical protein n=1 Tax=Bacillus sp. WP8 TaxID=756828 RepID=UPI001C92C818
FWMVERCELIEDIWSVMEGFLIGRRVGEGLLLVCNVGGLLLLFFDFEILRSLVLNMSFWVVDLGILIGFVVKIDRGNGFCVICWIHDLRVEWDCRLVVCV